jgi:hypothetical protein
MGGHNVRTNFRLQGNIIAMESATDLTAYGQLLPTGYLAYSACCLLMFIGDDFIAWEASHSTGA